MGHIDLLNLIYKLLYFRPFILNLTKIQDFRKIRMNSRNETLLNGIRKANQTSWCKKHCQKLSVSNDKAQTEDPI